MIDDGYIKYWINWEQSPPLAGDLSEVIAVRNRLYKMGLIGYYEQHQVGYGNISILSEEPPSFWVSGTQTGHIPVLGAEHFALATAWDLDENRLDCRGPVKASSESLTHAAVYACSPEIKAVIHIHHLKLWKWMQFGFPCTVELIPYGTPEMAREVLRLYQETDLPKVAAFAMKGHEEGIFTFGKDLDEAFSVLSSILNKWQQTS